MMRVPLDRDTGLPRGEGSVFIDGSSEPGGIDGSICDGAAPSGTHAGAKAPSIIMIATASGWHAICCRRSGPHARSFSAMAGSGSRHPGKGWTRKDARTTRLRARPSRSVCRSSLTRSRPSCSSSLGFWHCFFSDGRPSNAALFDWARSGLSQCGSGYPTREVRERSMAGASRYCSCR